MFRRSRAYHLLSSALFVLAAGCNLVIGNEDGVLEGDAATPDPADRDAWVIPTPDREAATPDPDASTPEPDASSPDPDAPATADTDGSSTHVDASSIDAGSVDAAAKDVSKSGDAAEDRAVGADASSCESGASICAEGQSTTEMQMCGPCGRGVQTRKRTCLAGGCGFGDWSAWSACSVTTAECMPGQTDSDSQACGACNTGTQSRTRSCTSACTWGAWGAFGACGSVTAECLPDHWRCCGAGKWEWCYVNTCKWTGGCAPCNGECSC